MRPFLSLTRPKFGFRKISSLPERWKRGRRRAAISSLAAVTLFAGALHTKGGADVLDSWWLRARFSLREWWGEKQFGPLQDPRIVVVEIDDYSIEKWNDELLIEWGGHIADAINHIHKSGARLIALDWTQSVETDARLNQTNDQKLGAALNRAGQNGRIAMVKLVKPQGGYVLPAPSLLFSLPDAAIPGGEQKYLGFADLVTQNSVQTALFPEIPTPQGREVSFASRVVENSGLAPREPMPLRDDGSFLINYLSGTGPGPGPGNHAPFERVSLYDVALAGAKNAPPDARWKDKIVFFGSTFKGNNDFHGVPFMDGLAGSRLVPGVLVQANAARTLLDNNPIQEPDSLTLWLLAGLLGATGVGSYASLNWGRAAFATFGVGLGWTALSWVLFLAWDYALPLVVPLLSLLFGVMLMGGYRSFSEERERAQVMKIWGRHQDPRLIEELLANPDWRGGEGREVVVTVLFADLKNFTKTVESLSPDQALEALNRYLSLIARTVKENGGLVDKFLGDGLMAQWGAPVPRDDDAFIAVKTCLEIEEKLAAMTPELRAAGQVTFEARLTLHTGPVVAGPVGSDDSKLEYTLIGDTVNVTSRLQETAKELGSDFLISETTFDALGGQTGDSIRDSIRIGRETHVAIRGRQQPLRVFEILGAQTAPIAPKKPKSSKE